MKNEIMIEKICPILMAIENRKDIQKCFKEVCAWWDIHYNCCAVLSSAILLELLAKRKNIQSRTQEKSDSSQNPSQK